jgi:integrase
MTVEKRRQKWAYRFKYEGEIYFKSGFDLAAEAEAAESELRLTLSSTVTFSKMAQRRLEHVKVYCTMQHFRDTRAILGHFPEWSNMPLLLITKEMINHKILDLAKELSPNNVNRHLRGLRSLFTLAVQEGLIPRNPTTGIKFLPIARAARVVPTPQDIKEVLLRADPHDQYFLTIAWQTAARISEITQLTWEDVDFKEGTVRLWTRKAKGRNRTPRTVPMLPDVRKALEHLYKTRVKESPWVFTSPEKMRKYPDQPNEWSYGYRKKLLRRLTNSFTFHCLRHSTASTLAALGVELPVIQKILGHARPTTTDLYLSMMPGGISEGMNRLAQFLGESDVSTISNTD